MKSVSTFFMSAMLLAGSLVQATPSVVPEPRAAELRNAISIVDLHCIPNSGYVPDYEGIKRTLQTAQTVILDDSGAQPVLVFLKIWPQENFRVRVSVTTSADFKKIDKLIWEVQSVQPVNFGTLVNPKIINTFATDKQMRCFQKWNFY